MIILFVLCLAVYCGAFSREHLVIALALGIVAIAIDKVAEAVFKFAEIMCHERVFEHINDGDYIVSTKGGR